MKIYSRQNSQKKEYPFVIKFSIWQPIKLAASDAYIDRAPANVLRHLM